MAESEEVVQRLTSIETKLDHALEKGADHEKRIRWLERVGWGVVFITGVLGADWFTGGALRAIGG